jgi:hypothetical protein
MRKPMEKRIARFIFALVLWCQLALMLAVMLAVLIPTWRVREWAVQHRIPLTVALLVQAALATAVLVAAGKYRDKMRT